MSEQKRMITVVLEAADAAIAKSLLAKWPLFGEVEPGIELIGVYAGNALNELDAMRERPTPPESKE